MTTGQTLTPRELLDLVRAEWHTSDPDALKIGNAHWHELNARDATPEDAETCRILMRAAGALRRNSESVLWQSRALVRFGAVNWPEGIAAIVMTNVYRLLAMVNEDYPQGQTYDVLHGCPEAILVLDQLWPYAVGPGSGHTFGPGPLLIARFIDEWTGLLHSLDGHWGEAMASYDRAMVHVENEPRAKLRIKLAQQLVCYLRAAENTEARTSAAMETHLLADSAAAKQNTDLRDLAVTNANRMTTGRADVMPYEIL